MLALVAAVPVIGLLSVLDRLLAAIGYEPALAAEIGRYLEAIRWGVPGFLAFGVLRALLAASARARLVMIVLVAAVPANAVLNWALIFGHLGLPALGIAGSGWSTAIIQSLMSLTLAAVLLLAPRRTPMRLGGRMLAPRPRHSRAWAADRRPHRARDRRVLDDRHPDGAARHRGARGAPAGDQFRQPVLHGAARDQPGRHGAGRLRARRRAPRRRRAGPLMSRWRSALR